MIHKILLPAVMFGLLWGISVGVLAIVIAVTHLRVGVPAYASVFGLFCGMGFLAAISLQASYISNLAEEYEPTVGQRRVPRVAALRKTRLLALLLLPFTGILAAIILPFTLESQDNLQSWLIRLPLTGALAWLLAPVEFLLRQVDSLTGGDQGSPEGPAQAREQARRLTNKAFYEVEKSRFEAAIGLLNKSIAIDPTYGPAYNELAFVYGKRLGQFAKAEENARQALACEPNNPKFWNAYVGIQKDLALNLRTQTAVRERVIQLVKILPQGSTNPSSHLARASLLALGGHSEFTWRVELETARKLYEALGQTAAGTPLTKDLLQGILLQAENQCHELSQFFARLPS